MKCKQFQIIDFEIEIMNIRFCKLIMHYFFLQLTNVIIKKNSMYLF